jgi:hypothetical protein
MTTAVRAPSFAVVVPTIGRDCLQRCLDALAAAHGPRPDAVIVVNDRPGSPLTVEGATAVIDGPGRGPAAARNAGWRVTESDWVVFVDDDVVVGPDWYERLADDLTIAARAGGVQGKLAVPLPDDRPATDWERNVSGLANARWVTADMAYRRDVLAEVGGFDERFPRAYREDADLALRVLEHGHPLVRGRRTSTHPVRPAPWWVSLTTQAGNADDPLMRRLHGPLWRERAGVPPGRRPRHLAITASGVLAVAAALTGHRRLATAGAALWAGGTAELIRARVAPGPKTPREVTAMVITSIALPPVATFHWLRGLLRTHPLRADRPRSTLNAAGAARREPRVIDSVP